MIRASSLAGEDRMIALSSSSAPTNKKMTFERQSPDTMHMLADAGWGGVVQHLLSNVNRVDSYGTQFVPFFFGRRSLACQLRMHVMSLHR
jgi:hypothetical protein